MSGAGNAVAEDWKNDNVTGKYSFDFHGPKAEEIAGKVTLSQAEKVGFDVSSRKELNNVATMSGTYFDNGNFERLDIGFGGTRGEIKK